MPKTDSTFDPGAYAPVADRISLFYAAHPTGRIVTDLVSRTDLEVVFKAAVYRSSEERRPAATGWAAEREGDGDVNLVACLENTETSAVGRALANLGFTAATQRPSVEEMEKAGRTRARLGRASAQASARSTPAEAKSRASARAGGDELQARADAATDVLELIAAAVRAGLRRSRADQLRDQVRAGALSAAELARLDGLLRRWIDRRRTDALRLA